MNKVASFQDFDIFENLPEDPELAFLVLDDLFRLECAQELHQSQQDFKFCYVDYIAKVIAAIKELGLEGAFSGRVPDIKQVDYDTYTNFGKEVKYYRTRLKIRHGRRGPVRTVSLDTPTKAKLRGQTQQLRGIFNKFQGDAAKRDRLLHILHEFDNEVGFMRTTFEAYATLAIETAGIIGEANIRPKALEALNIIARTIWNFRKDQEQKGLAVPEARRIELPNLARLAQQFDDDPRDEIPF